MRLLKKYFSGLRRSRSPVSRSERKKFKEIDSVFSRCRYAWINSEAANKKVDGTARKKADHREELQSRKGYRVGGGRKEQVDVNSEGDAIYSRRVAELSKCQAEALCVCLVRFPGVCLSHTRTYTRTHAHVRVCMCSRNERLLSRFGVRPARPPRVRRLRKDKETSVSGNGSPGYDGNWLLLFSGWCRRRGLEPAVRVNSQGRNTGQGASRENPSRNMSRVREVFLSVSFLSSHFPQRSRWNSSRRSRISVTDGPDGKRAGMICVGLRKVSTNSTLRIRQGTGVQQRFVWLLQICRLRAAGEQPLRRRPCVVQGVSWCSGDEERARCACCSVVVALVTSTV